jgi:enoyl-CoA hydratase
MGAVRSEVRGRVLLITIQRPERRNAINGEVALQLEAAVDRLESAAELWAGVLAGAGGSFSSGADLNARLAGERITSAGGLAGLTRRRRSKPLIAAVEGFALAGGFELVLACDLVVAASDALFGLPEVKRSIVAAEGGLVRGPRMLPRHVAMELALTGEPLPAQRLHALGLVNRLCPAGEAVYTALELAALICANAPLAVREARAVVEEAAELPLSEAWAVSDAAYARIRQTADFREGPRAFVEKRPPRWTAG